MGSEQLAYTYYDYDDAGGGTTYLAGTPKSDLPASVVEKLAGNALAFGTSEAEQPSASRVLGVEEPPPRAGAGSGKDAWADFARANGVEVEDHASRDEIIGVLEERGIIEPS